MTCSAQLMWKDESGAELLKKQPVIAAETKAPAEAQKQVNRIAPAAARSRLLPKKKPPGGWNCQKQCRPARAIRNHGP